MMYRLSFAGAFALAVLTTACATPSQSILLGVGTGAAAGAGTGALIGHDAAGAAIGVATGAVAGGVLAYLFSKGKGGSQSSAPSPSDAEKYPFLTRPEVRTLWIPDTIEGDRFIEKHRVFVIDKNSSWSKDNE